MACCDSCTNNGGGVCIDTAVNSAMQSAKLSGWLDDIIKVGGSLLTGSHTPKAPECTPPAGCFKCTTAGQGFIAGCMDAFWLQTLPNAKLTLADVPLLEFLNTVNAGLSNSAFFTPQSDSYLAQSKARMQTEIAAVQARIDAAKAPAAVAAAAAATAATNPAPSNLIDTLLNDNILMYGGIMVVVFFLVRSK